ncbi:MAG: ABC transporter permease subunit [Chloroflexota bacterium]|nr:ABC transporter permease subunit [Chloroflexota bacterium]
MIRFTARQVFIAVQLFLGISIVIFIVISLYPGDPIANLFGPYGQAWSNGQDTADLQARFSGDTPGPVRYLFWMKEVLTGNLGHVGQWASPVGDVVREALPITLGLVAVSLAVALIGGSVFALILTLWPESISSRFLSAIPMFLASVPTAFLTIWGIYLFAVRLGWLPALGLWTPGGEETLNLDLVRHAILPTVVLALPFIAIYMRYAQQAVLNATEADPAGPGAEEVSAGEMAVRSLSLLPTVGVPLLRNLSQSLAPLMGSALVVESLLSLGGLGHVAYRSLFQREYPVVTAAILVGTVAVIAARLLIDVICGWLDSAIRQSAERSTPTPGEPGTAGPDAAARQLGPPLELIDRPLEHRPWNTARRRFRAQWPAMAGLVVLLAFLALAILGPFVAPYEPHEVVALRSIGESSASPWLGTDSFGRDVFSLLLHGARGSVGVGAVAVVISLVIGLAVGVSSARLGGLVDGVLMRITDVVMTVPALFLMMFLVIPLLFGVAGPGSVVAVAIGIVSWPGFARLVRRQVLLQRQAGAASDSVGPESRMLGNLAGPLMVAVAYGFAAALLAEAALSFLGLGSSIPPMTWGQMLGQSRGLAFLTTAPGVIPTILIVLSVLSAHLVGGGLRHAFATGTADPDAAESGDDQAALDL